MKKWTFILLLFLVSLPLVGQGRAERKAAKAKKAGIAYQNMKTLISEGNFEFVGNWATPFNGIRVNLIGNPNYLRIVKDSTSTHLPFFGEVRRSVGYGQGSGVSFDGPLQEYTVAFDDTKHQIKISFRAKHQTELFDVRLEIAHSGNTTVIVNSSNRIVMRYQGLVAGFRDP